MRGIGGLIDDVSLPTPNTSTNYTGYTTTDSSEPALSHPCQMLLRHGRWLRLDSHTGCEICGRYRATLLVRATGCHYLLPALNESRLK